MTEIEQLYANIDMGFPWLYLVAGIVAGGIIILLAYQFDSNALIFLSFGAFAWIGLISPMIQIDKDYEALQDGLEANIVENYQVEDATVHLHSFWSAEDFENTHTAHVILSSDVVVKDLEILYRPEHDIVVFLKKSDSNVTIDPAEGSNAEAYLEQQADNAPPTAEQTTTVQSKAPSDIS